MIGKIIKGIAGFYYVADGTEDIYECHARGILRTKGTRPAVGDMVEFEPLGKDVREGSITRILPRKNELIRPLCANIDQAVAVFAVKDPKPDRNLLDRICIYMDVKDIPLVLCINKADLAGEDVLDALKSAYGTVCRDVIFTSAVDGRGLEKLKNILKKKTTIFTGPSGTGKSSLTNAITGSAVMETGNVSRKIQRGKHTTRHAELFSLGGGTYIMDTPGFGAMETELEERELKEHFAEFRGLSAFCRFGADCMHMEEPGCRVKAMVEEGLIQKSRYENYRQIYAELKNRRKY